MKKLSIIFLFILCISCSKDPVCDIPYPPAPYGGADDTIDWKYLEGRRLIIFVYNCLEDSGVLARYYQEDPCLEYDYLEIRGNCIIEE